VNENLSPRQELRDPLDMRGIPGVVTRRPKPRRPSALAGTKELSFPADLEFGRSLHPNLSPDRTPSLCSRVLGWLAVAAAVGLAVWVWGLLRWGYAEDSPFGGGWSVWAVVLLLAANHVCGVFAQVVSDGRNTPGALAIPAAYVGVLLVLVIDWLL
jgi:hypothetical protein